MPKTAIIPCTKEEMDALLNASLDDDFYYMMFFVAKSTGRRLGEFCGVHKKEEVRKEEYVDRHGNKKFRTIYKRLPELEGGVQIKDIDFEKKVMMTYILKRRRRIQKEAILTDEAVRLIRQYIATNHLKLEDYLFRKRTMRAIQDAVMRYAKIAGITHKVNFHNFRHYFATSLIKAGMHYDQIAKLTGHGSPGTLVNYDHAVASDMRELAEKHIKNL